MCIIICFLHMIDWKLTLIKIYLYYARVLCIESRMAVYEWQEVDLFSIIRDGWAHTRTYTSTDIHISPSPFKYGEIKSLCVFLRYVKRTFDYTRVSSRTVFFSIKKHQNSNLLSATIEFNLRDTVLRSIFIRAR